MNCLMKYSMMEYHNWFDKFEFSMWDTLAKSCMSSIICPRIDNLKRRKTPWQYPIGFNVLVSSLSVFTTSNINLTVEGSSHSSPFNRNLRTRVPLEALYELLPSVWSAQILLSTTYCPAPGNIKDEVSTNKYSV